MTLEKIKQNKNILEEYISMYTKMQDEREEGREEGIKEGIKENTSYLAKSFRDMGFPIDKIAMATGLSQAEIKSL